MGISLGIAYSLIVFLEAFMGFEWHRPGYLLIALTFAAISFFWFRRAWLARDRRPVRW